MLVLGFLILVLLQPKQAKEVTGALTCHPWIQQPIDTNTISLQITMKLQGTPLQNLRYVLFLSFR